MRNSAGGVGVKRRREGEERDSAEGRLTKTKDSPERRGRREGGGQAQEGGHRREDEQQCGCSEGGTFQWCAQGADGAQVRRPAEWPLGQAAGGRQARAWLVVCCSRGQGLIVSPTSLCGPPPLGNREGPPWRRGRWRRCGSPACRRGSGGVEQSGGGRVRPAAGTLAHWQRLDPPPGRAAEARAGQRARARRASQPSHRPSHSPNIHPRGHRADIVGIRLMKGWQVGRRARPARARQVALREAELLWPLVLQHEVAGLLGGCSTGRVKGGTGRQAV